MIFSPHWEGYKGFLFYKIIKSFMERCRVDPRAFLQYCRFCREKIGDFKPSDKDKHMIINFSYWFSQLCETCFNDEIKCFANLIEKEKDKSKISEFLLDYHAKRKDYFNKKEKERANIIQSALNKINAELFSYCENNCLEEPPIEKVKEMHEKYIDPKDNNFKRRDWPSCRVFTEGDEYYSTQRYIKTILSENKKNALGKK